MARLTYITRNYKGLGHGGGKARVDVEDALQSMGAINLGIKRTYHSNKVIDFMYTLSGVLSFMCSVKNGDVVVLQYPVKKYFRLICNIAHKKGAKVITLIHDLGCFRRKKLTVEEEMRKLAHSDAIIAANTHTIKWLKEHGCKVPMTDQVVWDYLSGSQPDGGPTEADTCLFVGDLRPSHNGYLYSLPASLKVNLYGNGCPDSAPVNIVSHGFTEADEVIAHGDGRWGLLWYGTGAIHDEKEFIGEYIRYCNPHKLALYLRANKPVVVWEHAAAADFVKENGVGITVESFEDIDKKLSQISEAEYNDMVENTRRVAKLMAEGYFIKSAVRRAESLLNGSATQVD